MHPEHTPEQQALKESVRRFCVEQATPERLAAWDREPSGVDADSWRRVAELGWFGLGVPAAAGGSGLGLTEVACVVEECGRGLMPPRVINAICTAALLSGEENGTYESYGTYSQATILASLATGGLTVAFAFDERRGREPGSFETRVAGEDPAPCLEGEKCFVADAAAADLHLVAARDGDGLSLFFVERAAAAGVEALRTFDGERQAVVRYAAAPALGCLGSRRWGAAALLRIRRRRAALALAEMLGGMEAALAMTVDYVKQREQFGQKIGVFQAVQHQVADMATALTASRHLAWQAITRLAAGAEARVELATAQAFVAPAFKRVTLAAHHLHGGAGYVVEHALHRHAERAQALCIRYAPEEAALAAVAAELLDD